MKKLFLALLLCLIPTSGFAVEELVHYKCWDDADNTTVTDQTGVYTGTSANNTSTMSADAGLGKVFDMNGTTDTVNCANVPATGATVSWTFWVNAPAHIGHSSIPLSKYDYGSGDRCWVFYNYHLQSGKMRFIFSDNGAYTDHAIDGYTSITVWDNTRNFVAVTFNAGTVKVYVDGVEDTSLTITVDDSISTIHTGANNMRISGYENNGVFGSGDGGAYSDEIDEVRVYTKVLSLSEIRAIYNGGSGTNGALNSPNAGSGIGIKCGASAGSN